MDVKPRSNFLFAKHGVPYLRKSKAAAIVNTVQSSGSWLPSKDANRYAVVRNQAVELCDQHSTPVTSISSSKEAGTKRSVLAACLHVNL